MGQQLKDTLVLHSERLSVADGLSQGLILCLLQDKDGIMWFGTKDGLNKYDGYHFTVYRHESGNAYSLPDNNVRNIAEDDNGNLWIGTLDNGLCLFDRAAEMFYSVKLSNDSSNKSVYGMQYARGRLLIQSYQLISYDVSHIYPGKYEHVDLSDNAILFNRVKHAAPFRWMHYSLGFDVQLMSDGSIWYPYRESVVVFDIKANEYARIKSFSTDLLDKDNKEGNWFYPLPQPNRLLCINNKYITVYDTTANKIIKRISFQYNGNNELVVVVKNHYGNYYISKNFGELNYHFNTSNYELQPVKIPNANKLLLDQNGVLWMGTPGFGLIKHDYRKQLFTPLKNYSAGTPISINGDFVSMATKQPHIVNLYSGSSKPILPPNTWNPAWENQEYVLDREGIHWFAFALEDSLYLINYYPAHGIVKKQNLQFAVNSNRLFLFTDSNDNLWLEAEDLTCQPLLMKIDKNTLQKQAQYRLPVFNNLVNGIRFISSFWQNAAGIFWFATSKGLFRFNEKQQQWKHYQHDPANAASLSTNKLFTICPDPTYPEKYLWLGTDGFGLTRFEIATGNCIHFNEKNGLPNSVVYGILNDNAGNLWLSTNNGLCVINPTSVNKNQTSPLEIKAHFTSDDGLPGNEFNRYEYYKLSNGHLFFGGVEGGVVFNPDDVLAKEAPPSIIFTGLSVYNKPVSHRTDSTIISQNITYAKSITLPHDKNMFSISFAALEYRAADKKQYKYYLENYDNTWIEAGSKNEATYTNLPPGTYTFHVTGKTGLSDWATNNASIKIIILPAWHQTWWFRLLVLLTVGGTLYLFYRYRLEQQHKLHTIRNRIASDLHDEIGSTLSSISISSSIIQYKLQGTTGEVNMLLNQISNNTDSMMEAMSDIVWSINTKNDRFDNVINRMRAFAIGILEPKSCLVHFNTSNEIEVINLDMSQRKNIYLIFKEAINNAAKYAQCENVWVSISLSGSKKLVLKIKDDGTGFESTTPGEKDFHESSIFGGNGIANMHKRASEINGKLKINHELGYGTEVILEFII